MKPPDSFATAGKLMALTQRRPCCSALMGLYTALHLPSTIHSMVAPCSRSLPDKFDFDPQHDSQNRFLALGCRLRSLTAN
jgi:hypothetical protein